MMIAACMLCSILIAFSSAAHPALLEYSFSGGYRNLGPCWVTDETCPPGEPSTGYTHISFQLDTDVSGPGTTESSKFGIGRFKYSGGFSNLKINVEGFGRFAFDSGFDAVGGADRVAESSYESFFGFSNLAGGLVELNFFDVWTELAAPLDPNAPLTPQLPSYYAEGFRNGSDRGFAVLTLGQVTALGVGFSRISVVEVPEPPASSRGCPDFCVRGIS